MRKSLSFKIIIVFLVITLTYVNFFIVGKHLLEGSYSYAYNVTEAKEAFSLKQEVITNKVYEDEEGNYKRIIQTAVEFGFIQSEYLLKTMKMEIEADVIEGENLQKVMVTTTNQNNFTNSTAEYNQTDKTININLTNGTNKEEAKSDGFSRMVITYIYENKDEFDTNLMLNLLVKVSEVKVYDVNGEFSKSKASTMSGTISQFGEAVEIEINREDMYKVKMEEKDTEYTESISINFNCTEISEEISIKEQANKFYKGETESTEIANTEYKTTKINKAKLVNVLGQNGILEIKNSNTQEQLISITKQGIEENSIANNENVNIEIGEEFVTLTYVANVSEIEMVFTNVTNQTLNQQADKNIPEVSLDVENTKILKAVTNQTSFDTLVTTYIVALGNAGTENIKATKINEQEYKVNFNSNAASLSTSEENNVKFTLELVTNEEKYKLYDNSKFTITLPEEVKNINIISANLMYDRELSLDTYNSEDNKIELNLSGKQTNNNTQNATIIIEANVELEKFIEDKNAKIQIKGVEGAQTIIEKEADIKITSPNTLITETKITGLTNDVTLVSNEIVKAEVIAENSQTRTNLKTTLLNNTGTTINKIQILGRLPMGENKNLETGETLKSDFAMSLENAISVEGKTAKVYYSENIEETLEGTNWVENISDISKAKSYKIVIEEVEQGTNITVNYDLLIPENIGYLKSTYQTMGIYYTVAEQQREIYRTVKFETPSRKVVQSENFRIEAEVAVGGNVITEEDTVKEGETVRYKVKVTNISNETMENVTLSALKPENGVFYTLVEADEIATGEMTYYYAEDENRESESKIAERLSPGESINLEYQVVASSVEDGKNLDSVIKVTADGKEETATISNKIEQGKLKLNIRSYYTENVKKYTNDKMFMFISIENISNEDLTNITMSTILDSIYKYEKEDSENTTDWKNNPSVEGQIITWTIPKLAKGEKETILITLSTGDLPLTQEGELTNLVVTAEENGNKYISNDYEKTIIQKDTAVNIIGRGSISGDTVEDQQIVTYTYEIENIGILPTDSLTLNSKIQNGLELQGATLIDNEGNREEILTSIFDSEFNAVNRVIIEPGKKCYLEINVKVDTEALDKGVTTVTNKLTITGSNIKETTSNEIVYKVKGEELPVEESYSISGTVWLDENRDGKKDENETVLPEIEVMLLDSETNKNVVGTDENIVSAKTDVNGKYEFKYIPEGNYIVVFKYDTSKYNATTYRKAGIEEDLNSDAIDKTINEKNVAATDTLEISSNLTNIDLGLVERKTFDLSLTKKIAKITVKNNGGTTVYDFKNTDFAKIEIASKYLSNSTILIEYEIGVTNEGEVTAYVNSIVDYKPEGLEFSSELNTSWYEGNDGNLYCVELTADELKPGETKNVKLILVKTMKNSETGTIENQAELFSVINTLGLKDQDSTPGNKATGEDDISAATVIIAVKTGGAVTYILIILISMIIIGGGIYLINKKVLRERT